MEGADGSTYCDALFDLKSFACNLPTDQTVYHCCLYISNMDQSGMCN